MSVERVTELLAAQQYIADRPVAMALHLGTQLGKPLLIEGEAGVGKTELAKSLALATGAELIRLQCYEGLDAAAALYDWNFPKQVLRIKLGEQSGQSVAEREAEIFSREFLLERPLLRAITRKQPPVLLIDEIDRADEEFEALLLELLSDFQITIPELGTIKATHRPHVILTSNRTRELGEALRRRCLYLWVDYPAFEKELAIVRAKVAGLDEHLAGAVTRFVQRLRGAGLEKAPGVAETLDWARALVAIGAPALTPDLVQETVGLLAKGRDDAARITGPALERLLADLTPGV